MNGKINVLIDYNVKMLLDELTKTKSSNERETLLNMIEELRKLKELY